jgi:hypothetical protein
MSFICIENDLVAITSVMGKGKFGFKWYASARRIIDEENGSQIQDIIKLFCTHHFLNTPGTVGTIKPPGLGRISIVRE